MRIPVGAIALATVALAIVPAAQAQRLTIVVTSEVTQATAHDTVPKGKANKGDSIAFKDLLLATTPLFGKKKGKAVAYDAGTMTYTSATGTSVTCTATFPGFGTITFAGPFATRKDGTTVVPITGGTGAFKGVTGTVTIGAGATRAPNTYVLNLPHPVDVNATGIA